MRYLIQAQSYERGYTYHAEEKEEAAELWERLQDDPEIERLEIFEVTYRSLEKWSRSSPSSPSGPSGRGR